MTSNAAKIAPGSRVVPLRNAKPEGHFNMQTNFNLGLLGRTVLVVGLLVGAIAAKAGVVIVGTRVIYPADSRDVQVRLNNVGTVPALVQSWIDAGDPTVTPENSKAPFVLTPPIARLDGEKSQVLRLIFTGQGLPQDKESLFFLNVLEIPPKAKTDANTLQFAVRTRIKLFYRPTALNRSEAAGAAANAVTWKLKSLEGGKAVLEARNGSPYYVNLTEIRLAGADADAGDAASATLPPGEAQEVTVSDVRLAREAVKSVKYQLINDYGGLNPGSAALALDR